MEYRSFIKKMNNVYKYLGDDTSRQIYKCRVMYALTGDDNYIDELIGYTSAFQWLKDKVEKLNDNVFIYGAGYRGRLVAKLFPQCVGIIDSDESKQGNFIENIRVYSLSEAIKIYSSNISVIVTPMNGNDEILSMLEKNGITKIINLEPEIQKTLVSPYFDLPYLQKCEKEVFVDCGAYDGNTSLGFVKWCDNNFEHIYLFEPDIENIKKCQLNLSSILEKNSYTFIDKGCWSEKTTLFFHSTADESTHVSDDGNTVLEVSSIDEEVDSQKRITYIKMDIEGSELEALKGARNTIIQDRPNLAICVYHKMEDIFTIPEYIENIYKGEYKLYLRHYTITEWDTVLYVVPNNWSNE